MAAEPSGDELRAVRESFDLSRERVAGLLGGNPSAKTIERAEMGLAVRQATVRRLAKFYEDVLSGRVSLDSDGTHALSGPSANNRGAGHTDTAEKGSDAATGQLEAKETPRSVRKAFSERIAELTSDDEGLSIEEEARFMRMLGAAIDNYRAGGPVVPPPDDKLILIIKSIGAGIVADLEDARRKRGK